MRDLLWCAGAIFATLAGTALVTGDPLMAGVVFAALAALVALFLIPRNQIGSFGLCAAITVTVAVPASEFSGSFRQGISAAAILIMLVSYFRSDIRRTLSKAFWLIPAWLLVIGLGDFTADGAIKWVVYSGLIFTAVLLATRAKAQPVLRWIVVLALVQAGVAALQVLGGLSLPWEQITDISGNEILGPSWMRAPGTMGHPLPMTFLVVCAFVILVRDPKWMPRMFRVAAYVALTASVIFAGSRSGALIVAALVLFATGRKITLARAFFGTMAASSAFILVVMSGFFESQAFEKIMASGSVYHRQGALDSIGRLLSDQGAKEVLLGGGYTGVPKAFDLGLLQTDGFNTVDNQFIVLLVMSGLLGLAIFCAVLISAFRLGSGPVRMVLLGAVGMFFIFDVMLWTSASVLLMVAVGFALSPDRSRGSAVPPEYEQHDTSTTSGGRGFALVAT